jgi:hypothetical protein
MRGEIYNRDRARQLRDFTGLQFGKITPTDIDGFVEFRGKLFIFIEIKLEGHELPHGQRKALERACDAIASAGMSAWVLVVEHNTDPQEDIDVASCPVREFRYDAQWGEPIKPPVTCREAISRLLDKEKIVL